MIVQEVGFTHAWVILEQFGQAGVSERLDSATDSGPSLRLALVFEARYATAPSSV